MVEFRTCDYTGEEIEPGTGIQLVKNDGTILTFKHSKAIKNYQTGKEPRELEWTSIGNTTSRSSRSRHTVESILELLNQEYPQSTWGETLSTKGVELYKQMKRSDRESPSTREIIASLGVIPAISDEKREVLVREVRDFAEDIPEGPSEESGEINWAELYQQTDRFLNKKQSVYEQFKENGMENVDELKRKQLQVFLGDRLRYVSHR